jgi:hypothetical protein
MALVGHIEATTKKYYDKKVTDCVMFHSPFFMRLFAASKTRGGGTDYVWHPRYARRSIQWYGRFEILDRTPLSHITEAQLDWVRCNANATLDGGDVNENTPSERVLDLLDEEMKSLRDDTIYGLNTAIWTGAAGQEPTGITTAIATDPTSGTYANIVRGTDDVGAGDFLLWWQNGYKDASAAALTTDLMEEAYLKPCIGANKPSLIVTSKDGFRKLYAIATDIQRLPDATLAKLGFESIHWNNCLVVWDDKCPLGSTTGQKARYYFFNEDDLELRFITKMKRKPWFEPEDQDAMVTDLRNHFVFAVKNPKLHCVLFNVKEN